MRYEGNIDDEAVTAILECLCNGGNVLTMYYVCLCQVPGGAVAAGLHAAAHPPRLPHRHLLLAAGHLSAAPGMNTIQ